MAENIISIRKHDARLANEAFADFMQKTESALNDKAQANPMAFSALTASRLERLSVQCMREICADTPFRADEIRLVSGLAFPDIVTETFYGVEVKSTQADHWRSTGSSIIETTRDKNVASIYMLFGKLGGKPAVRCRPYEDCLYDITVTHSPRYLIDMNTASNGTIFAKMNTTYDRMRLSTDSIAQVRRYYRNKAKAEHRGEMPWWLDEIDDPTISRIASSDISLPSDRKRICQERNLLATGDSMIIRHISSLTQEEKKKIIRQLYILFPADMIDSNYAEPAMWLVAYHKIVCHNMRDFMTAGGQAKFLNGRRLSHPLPAIVKRFLDFSALIKVEIEYMYAEIDVFNPNLLEERDVFMAWVGQVDSLLNRKFGRMVTFAHWVANGDVLSVDA